LQIIYGHVCHQAPEKLIYFNGAHTFVCARCTGIYTGIFAVTFFFLLFPNLKTGPRRILISGFIPVLLDVFFVKINIYEYSKVTAFISGFILGSVGIYYFYETISTKIKGNGN